MDREFVGRLEKAFGHATMAEVARRLGIPHATVRNYYKQARLPAPDVLIKIANETGISLNWLLSGSGDMYGGQSPRIGLGKFIEQRIGEMIDERLAAKSPAVGPETAAVRARFDIRNAIVKFDEPERILGEWYRHDGREAPHDLGLAFFRGWESFSQDDKVAAIQDAKELLDRALQN